MREGSVNTLGRYWKIADCPSEVCAQAFRVYVARCSLCDCVC